MLLIKEIGPGHRVVHRAEDYLMLRFFIDRENGGQRYAVLSNFVRTVNVTVDDEELHRWGECLIPGQVLAAELVSEFSWDPPFNFDTGPFQLEHAEVSSMSVRSIPEAFCSDWYKSDLIDLVDLVEDMQCQAVRDFAEKILCKYYRPYLLAPLGVHPAYAKFGGLMHHGVQVAKITRDMLDFVGIPSQNKELAIALGLIHGVEHMRMEGAKVSITPSASSRPVLLTSELWDLQSKWSHGGKLAEAWLNDRGSVICRRPEFEALEDAMCIEHCPPDSQIRIHRTGS